MMQYFEIYEDKKTYLLSIDHKNKFFSVGSFDGKPKKHNDKFKTIDASGYLSEISKISSEYILTCNNLQYNTI